LPAGEAPLDTNQWEQGEGDDDGINGVHSGSLIRCSAGPEWNRMHFEIAKLTGIRNQLYFR